MSTTFAEELRQVAASRPAFVLRLPDGQATHLQARPAGPVRVNW